MKNKNKFINNSRQRSWVVVMLFAFLGIFPQYSPSFSQNPEWIAYDIGDVYFINSIASEKDTLWIGTADSGLIKLNKITREYTTYNLKDLGFEYNFIESIVVDKRGNKWLGTSDGLIKFDGINWTMVDSLAIFYYNYLSSSNMKFDKYGNLWVKRYPVGGGFNADIAVFDGADWTVYDGLDSMSLYFGRNQFAFDSSNVMWGYVFQKGLKEFNGSNWTLHKAGDLFSYIRDIEIGKDNRIKWVTTFEPMSGWNQLVRFVDDSNWTIYNAWDNQPDILGYSIGSLTIESDSSIWIGGDDILTWFDGKDTWRYYTFARGYNDNSINAITIDEYGNKWLAVGIYDHTSFPDYIVVLRDGGVELGIDGEATVPLCPIFPNPARDFINTAAYFGWQYQIYDLLGSCMQSGIIDAGNISVAPLPAGFYTVRFFKEGKQVVEKMMKE